MRPVWCVLLAVVLSGCLPAKRAEQAYERGKMCAQAKAYGCALREMTAAVKARPDVAKYHYGLAWVLGQSGAYDQAAAEYREALRLDPAFPNARANLQWATNMIEAQRASLAAEETRRLLQH